MSSEKSPLESLTPSQQARLRKLQAEIQFDKLTVSFSIDERDPNGRKKSAFYSVTASRGTGAEIPQMHEEREAAGFAPEDVKIVRTLLCKHVVRAVYEDAARRGMMSAKEASTEARSVLMSYDDGLVKLLQSQEPGDAQ
jgi:hypothetical protein